jgi:hypothetical protein
VSQIHVFGYASLVAGAGRPAVLPGYRRVWGVAMDNRVALPGYKVYEEPGGRRPEVDVAFLDLVDDPGGSVNGVLLEVDEVMLAALDHRERQYRRRDVTTSLGSGDQVPGVVWTYVGQEAGRSRVTRGRVTGSVVIQRAYRDFVEDGFAVAGPGALAAFRASTEPPPFPLADLVRVDL